jgi:hypothetical protein
MMLVIMGLIAGTLLASLNVYVLIPATALTTAVVLLNGLAAGKSAAWYAAVMVLTAAFLELGYFAASGVLLVMSGRAAAFHRGVPVSEADRSSDSDPQAIAKACAATEVGAVG